MLRKSLLLLTAIMAAFLVVMPVTAQEMETLAEGFNFPRGIAYDADGNLYVAEAGSGGEQVVLEIEGAQITGGLTSQVSVVAPDGTKSVAVGNLISVFNPLEGAGLGVIRAIPTEDSIWLVLSVAENLTVFSDAVVEIDKATNRVKNYIDLHLFEVENNPVNLPDGTEEILSNPADLEIGPDGKVYIVDTGANVLLTWTAADGLEMLRAWTDDPVPTSIEFAENGDFYIGFLGQGLAPGAGKIEHWSADGSELIETFSGLTNVTDILLDDAGNLYATQLVMFGDEGPLPNSGAVLMVTADGATPVAEGLNTPYGLAQDAEGNLVVSTGSAFAEPGAGAIIKIPMSA